MADDSYLISLKEAIKQHLSLFETNLSSIRSGKVNPAIIENISVECYGTRSPLKSLANIILQPPNILIVEPWDTNIINDISHALETSSLNITPQKTQNSLKLIFPALTQERRAELIKLVNTEKEKVRIEIKQERENVVKNIEKDFKGKILSEDQKFYLLKEVQKVIDEANKSIDEMTNKKESELKSV